ncbi:MAG: hypothetical protein ACKO0Z_13695 [Betaproteobacteria bacterium]|jgi:hypothetical protein
MSILLVTLGIVIPILLGILTWKRYDRIFKYSTSSDSTLPAYLQKLAIVALVVLLSMYGIFLVI